MGRRLKRKSTALRETTWYNSINPDSPKAMNLLNNPKPSEQNRAMKRFERGPAMVIRRSSRFLVSRLGKEIWTGFPQPIIAKPGLAKIIMRGISRVPIGSI